MGAPFGYRRGVRDVGIRQGYRPLGLRLQDIGVLHGLGYAPASFALCHDSPVAVYG